MLKDLIKKYKKNKKIKKLKLKLKNNVFKKKKIWKLTKKAKLFVCDIADKKKVSQIVKQQKFDLVMHFAGLVRVDESIKKPKKYINFNFEKTKIFLNICFNNKIDKLIFSSTASVYGKLNKSNVSENDKKIPVNP